MRTTISYSPGLTAVFMRILVVGPLSGLPVIAHAQGTHDSRSGRLHIKAAAQEAKEGPLASIIVDPIIANVIYGNQQQFTATGKDASGNTVPIPDPQWSVTGGGTIAVNGNSATFTATQEGNHTITATVIDTSGFTGSTDETTFAAIETTRNDTIVGVARIRVDPVTGTDKYRVPSTVELNQNYPNPFRLVTTIPYTLPSAGWAKLQVLDVSGGTLRILVNKLESPGAHEIRWDGRNESGLAVPPGTYLLRLSARGKVVLKKMIRIR